MMATKPSTKRKAVAPARKPVVSQGKGVSAPKPAPVKAQATQTPKQPVSAPTHDPLDGEFTALATALNLEPGAVRTEVAKIASAMNVTTERALSVFKSRNKNNLAKKTQTRVGRLLAIDGPRTVNTDNGPRNVATTVWAVQGDGGIEICDLTLWQGDDRDNSALVSGLTVGSAYEFDGTTREGDPGKIYMAGDGFNLYTGNFPAESEIIGEVEAVSIPDLQNYRNRNVFVRGVIGRRFSTSKASGVEISHTGSGVLTCYFADEIGSLPEAADVMILGRVSVRKNGTVVLNGIRAWTIG